MQSKVNLLLILIFTIPFVFLRTLGHERILVILNPYDRKATAYISGKLSGKQRLLLGVLPQLKQTIALQLRLCQNYIQLLSL